MNFNNIPMGLRVPIFFGEISINGATPAGGGTNPQPPIINCDGALNITDPIEIDGDWVLEVDGELVRPEATSIDDVIDYLNEAGFEVTIEDVPPVISCDGAVYSSELLVDYLAEHSSNPIWHLEIYDQVSGQLYSAITNNDLNLNSEYPDSMLPQALFDKRVNDDLDYGMNVNTHALSINNNTESNIRLKVIAYGHDELGRGIEITGIEDLNPTFTFFKNQPFEYDVRGCLSGVDGGGV